MKDAESAPSPDSAKEIGDAKGRVESVGGIRLQAEIMRKDPQPDQSCEAAEQDSSCHKDSTRCFHVGTSPSTLAGNGEIPSSLPRRLSRGCPLRGTLDAPFSDRRPPHSSCAVKEGADRP